ncbi:MAG TPA: hypothetical protein PLT07_05640, partial [Trueperaceae bacterium]|nr:hypothetical protein [Trueperaceae bacterium]
MTLSVLAPARYLSGAHSLAGVGAAVAGLTAAAPQQPRVFVDSRTNPKSVAEATARAPSKSPASSL